LLSIKVIFGKRKPCSFGDNRFDWDKETDQKKYRDKKMLDDARNADGSFGQHLNPTAKFIHVKKDAVKSQEEESNYISGVMVNEPCGMMPSIPKPPKPRSLIITKDDPSFNEEKK
jgi:hypothetical protein